MERAWGSDKEDKIQETSEALAKVRQALRTLVDVERQPNGCVIATDRRWKERWARWKLEHDEGGGGRTR